MTISRRLFLGVCGLLTGSRAFGVAGPHSDWDYISMDAPQGYGWKKVGYKVEDEYLVFRNGNQQFIFATTRQAFNAWMRAHNHCVIERPKNKDRRKVIFDHYMYGTPLNRQTPLPACERWRFKT